MLHWKIWSCEDTLIVSYAVGELSRSPWRTQRAPYCNLKQCNATFTSFSKSSGLLSGQVGAESLLCSAWSAQLMTAWGYYTVRVSSLHLHAAKAAFPVDVGTLSHRHLIFIQWFHCLTLIPSIKESWLSTSLPSLYSTYLLPLLKRQLIDRNFVAPKRLSTIKYSSEFPNLPPMSHNHLYWFVMRTKRAELIMSSSYSAKSFGGCSAWHEQIIISTVIGPLRWGLGICGAQFTSH